MPRQRRFLVINYWLGSRDEGVLEGPVLVSTRDYERFHLWDEPYPAVLGADEYQIIDLYPRGLAFEEAARRFASEYPWAVGLLPAAERPERAEAFWQDATLVIGRRVSAA
jgi:hypothetical protein